mmetsp:Transcript_509/g.1970  ORF Transcript_509/g.1970 Transcript_509/m.1970 type:complete len:275 (+) Transcript_509:1263-2087(+)
MPDREGGAARTAPQPRSSNVEEALPAPLPPLGRRTGHFRPAATPPGLEEGGVHDNAHQVVIVGGQVLQRAVVPRHDGRVASGAIRAWTGSRRGRTRGDAGDRALGAPTIESAAEPSTARPSDLPASQGVDNTRGRRCIAFQRPLLCDATTCSIGCCCILPCSHFRRAGEHCTPISKRWPAVRQPLRAPVAWTLARGLTRARKSQQASVFHKRPSGPQPNPPLDAVGHQQGKRRVLADLVRAAPMTSQHGCLRCNPRHFAGRVGCGGGQPVTPRG